MIDIFWTVATVALIYLGAGMFMAMLAQENPFRLEFWLIAASWPYLVFRIIIDIFTGNFP